jgi:hypothetical protein
MEAMVLGNLLIVVTEQLMGVSSAEIKGYSILLVRLRDLQDMMMNRVLFMSEGQIEQRSRNGEILVTISTALLVLIDGDSFFFSIVKSIIKRRYWNKRREM